MTYTFKINTTNVDKLKKQIKKFFENNDSIPPYDEVIEKLAYYIHSNSYMYVDEVQASDEDNAWDKVDDTRVIEEMEITNIDDSDEYEAEQRAKARYEAQLEDEAMERYYDEKYGK